MAEQFPRPGGAPMDTLLRQLSPDGSTAAGLDRLSERLRATGAFTAGPQGLAPDALARALGEAEIAALAREAGMPRDELLRRLAADLPPLLAGQGRGQAPPAGGQPLPPAPQMPMAGVLGGQFGGPGAEGHSGGAGAVLSHGAGAAGGDAGPLGGAGHAATHHPGLGASLGESPPRLGPAPVAPDDAAPGLADAGSPHGPRAASGGTGRPQGKAGGAGGDALTAREAGQGAGGKAGDETPGRITGRG